MSLEERDRWLKQVGKENRQYQNKEDASRHIENDRRDREDRHGSDYIPGTIVECEHLRLTILSRSAASAQLQCMNTSVAFFGAEKGTADFGSELNPAKTEGFWRKCCSRASTRC